MLRSQLKLSSTLSRRLLRQATSINCEAIDRRLLEVWKMLSHTGRSPAQVLYGHPLCTYVSPHPTAYKTEWQPIEQDCDQHTTQSEHEVVNCNNNHASTMPTLDVNQQARIQNPRTKHWDQVGMVLAYRKPRQYDVHLLYGHELIWKCHFLHPDTAPRGPLSRSPSDLQPTTASTFQVPV